MKTIKKYKGWDVHSSQKNPYDMFDNDSECLYIQGKREAYNIREEFHAANAHDTMDWLMSL